MGMSVCLCLWHYLYTCHWNLTEKLSFELRMVFPLTVLTNSILQPGLCPVLRPVLVHFIGLVLVGFMGPVLWSHNAFPWDFPWVCLMPFLGSVLAYVILPFLGSFHGFVLGISLGLSLCLLFCRVGHSLFCSFALNCSYYWVTVSNLLPSLFKKSGCEQIALIALNKRATVSTSHRSLMTKEQLWANFSPFI